MPVSDQTPSARPTRPSSTPSAARRSASTPRAVGETNPLHFDPEAARAAGHADVVAPPMFAVVYSSPSIGPAIFDPEVGINFAMMVHGGQEFVWGPLVVAGDEITTDASVKEISERGGDGLLRVRVGLDQPARRARLHRDVDQHREGSLTMSELEPGAAIPELRVTPDRYLTVRYAGASGDFNPIHIDEEFATSVGLPGRILHGLWTMAQVARATTDAGGGPQSLRRLAVQFRGMGVPEQEIVRDRHRGERRRRRGASSRRRPCRATRPDHPQRVAGDRDRLSRRAALRRLLQSDHALRASGADPARRSSRATCEAGHPVGLQAARADGVDVGPVDDPRTSSPSSRTQGLLAHPHTSAGRVPTDAGYRYFVDRLLPRGRGAAGARPRAVAGPPRGRRGDARDDARRSRRSRTCWRSSRPPRWTPPPSATSRCSCSSRRCSWSS